MGYVAFINGSGWTVELDDDGAHIIKSERHCDLCGDDRIFKDGTCFVCNQLMNRVDKAEDA